MFVNILNQEKTVWKYMLGVNTCDKCDFDVTGMAVKVSAGKNNHRENVTMQILWTFSMEYSILAKHKSLKLHFVAN